VHPHRHVYSRCLYCVYPAGICDLHIKNIIWQYFLDFITHKRGATAVEYGLLVGIIGGALILGLGSVREGLLGIFTAVVDALNSAMSS